MQYGELCDRTLEMHGQQAITPAAFGTDNETKYQRQLRRFFEVCHEMILLRMNEPWMQRRFELPLSAGVSTYPLDASVAIEGLVPFSFILQGLGTAGWLRPYSGGYNAWKSVYHDESLVTSAQPIWWFETPTEAAEVRRTNNIRFDPIPDTDYIVEYQAKIIAPTPQAIDDELVWPDEYVHVIQLAAGRLLEWSFQSGGEGSILDLAQQTIQNVKQWASGPEERKRGVRMDVSIKGRTPRRGYGTNAVGRQGWRR
jgi:hypothetical protein